MPVSVNLAKAKVLTKDRLRVDRKPLLEAQDVLFMKVIQTNQKQDIVISYQ